MDDIKKFKSANLFCIPFRMWVSCGHFPGILTEYEFNSEWEKNDFLSEQIEFILHEILYYKNF